MATPLLATTNYAHYSRGFIPSGNDNDDKASGGHERSTSPDVVLGVNAYILDDNLMRLQKVFFTYADTAHHRC